MYQCFFNILKIPRYTDNCDNFGHYYRGNRNFPTVRPLDSSHVVLYFKPKTWPFHYAYQDVFEHKPNQIVGTKLNVKLQHAKFKMCVFYRNVHCQPWLQRLRCREEYWHLVRSINVQKVKSRVALWVLTPTQLHLWRIRLLRHCAFLKEKVTL